MDNDEIFLTYYKIKKDKTLLETTYTRKDFFQLVTKALIILEKYNIKKNDCVCHFFSANRTEDLIFRMASVIVGCIPVTINWSADTIERVQYKANITKSKLLLIDENTNREFINSLQSNEEFMKDRIILNASEIYNIDEDNDNNNNINDSDNNKVKNMMSHFKNKEKDQTRIIIFTSGTTGKPKGVKLTYGSYETNRATFESFLQASDVNKVKLCPVIVNPMHHTNSTAFTDWALRRNNTHLHLFERYTTPYWNLLANLGKEAKLTSDNNKQIRIIAPAVSRHFDFLENLAKQGKLPILENELKNGLNHVDFLVGSAPVGPSTVARLQRFTGRLPFVRFGSTETCLQVMGTPRTLTQEIRLNAFKLGWEHFWKGEASPGYYIGQDHAPNTYVKIVRSRTEGDSLYMEECSVGEPGFVVTSGGNVMSGYVGNDEATKKAFCIKQFDNDDVSRKWYLNLGDVAFALVNPVNGKNDIYWQSRDNALLIRGGANYAYAQINEELKQFAIKQYGIESNNDINVAVVGLKLNSEHEDDCMVTVEFANDKIKEKYKAILAEKFISDACDKNSGISKGSKPSFIRFGTIPRNFKGAILVKDLKYNWEEELKNRKKQKQ